VAGGLCSVCPVTTAAGSGGNGGSGGKPGRAAGTVALLAELTAADDADADAAADDDEAGPAAALAANAATAGTAVAVALTVTTEPLPALGASAGAPRGDNTPVLAAALFQGGGFGGGLGPTLPGGTTVVALVRGLVLLAPAPVVTAGPLMIRGGTAVTCDLAEATGGVTVLETSDGLSAAALELTALRGDANDALLPAGTELVPAAGGTMLGLTALVATAARGDVGERSTTSGSVRLKLRSDA